VVAAICEALELTGDERVLEIGTGSGYSACVLSILAREVLTIERIPELAETARELLGELGVANVEAIVGDGTVGLPDRAPFDAIAVHATAPGPPEALLSQLSAGGRLVIPIATTRADMLTLFRRTAAEADPETLAGFERHTLAPCRFVPLIGDEGFPE
jgi:protein-L-isoaspartate(D-aspartate) O-methyltransferase